MTFQKAGDIYIIRLAKGELLMESLISFVRDQNIQGGWATAIGGLSWAELGFYDLTAKAYAWMRFDEPLELLQLSGNIAWHNDEPFLHLHASVSDASQYAHGGHLREAEVNGTVEIMLTLLPEGAGLRRISDPETGLQRLDI